MSKHNRCLALTVVSWLLGFGVSSARLLTPAHEVTLEGWLGQGNQTFTLLYQKAAGNTASTFHAAVDGKGPTFTLLEATVGGSTYLVGGYNPQSWNNGGSSGSYNITSPDSARTAFIYNLTTLRVQRQRLNSDPWSSSFGSYQTHNYPLHGPTFGGGSDLHVEYYLTQGYASQYSYGAGSQGCGGVQAENILGFVTCGSGTLSFTVGALEVYTFEGSPPPPPVHVKEQGNTLVLLLAGVAIVGVGQRLSVRKARALQR